MIDPTQDDVFVILKITKSEAEKLAEMARKEWDYSPKQEDADFCLQVLEAIPL